MIGSEVGTGDFYVSHTWSHADTTLVQRHWSGVPGWVYIPIDSFGTPETPVFAEPSGPPETRAGQRIRYWDRFLRRRPRCCPARTRAGYGLSARQMYPSRRG